MFSKCGIIFVVKDKKYYMFLFVFYNYVVNGCLIYMKKGQEIYLVSFALALLSLILLYDLYKSPSLSPAVVKETAGNSSFKPSSQVFDDNMDGDGSYSNNNEDLQNQQKSKQQFSGIVNINTASIQDLMSLNGIGEVKANAIISYRTENGLFDSVDELTNVKGIGEKTVEKIRDRITV